MGGRPSLPPSLSERQRARFRPAVLLVRAAGDGNCALGLVEQGDDLSELPDVICDTGGDRGGAERLM